MELIINRILIQLPQNGVPLVVDNEKIPLASRSGVIKPTVVQNSFVHVSQVSTKGSNSLKAPIVVTLGTKKKKTNTFWLIGTKYVWFD